MELIRKISMGSRMNQIYIPKEKIGFNAGAYVVIKPIATSEITGRLFSYGSLHLSSLKTKIAEQIFRIILRVAEVENIFIVGSFLEEGYNFNDIDIIIIAGKRDIDKNKISAEIEEDIGVQAHLIVCDYPTLARGINSDPLFELMMSRYISIKRWITKKIRTFDYKKLDLQLFKSRALDKNFDYLTGKQKYDFIRNLIALKLFIEGERLTYHNLDNEVKKSFSIKKGEILNNMIADRKALIKIYNSIFKSLEKTILKGIEHESKQEQAD